MNADSKHGGPAFPKVVQEVGSEVDDGMTLRDYFAAKALQGFLAGDPKAPSKDPEEAIRLTVNAAYQMADAMLAERNK